MEKKRSKAHVTNSQCKNLYNASHIFIMMFMQRNEKCTYKFNAVVPLRVYIYVTLAVQVLPEDRMSLPSYQIKNKIKTECYETQGMHIISCHCDMRIKFILILKFVLVHVVVVFLSPDSIVIYNLKKC